MLTPEDGHIGRNIVFLRTFKNFKSFKNFKCEFEEVTSVCTQDGELIVTEWKVQQDATI
jgi:hypothetical protein